MKKSSPIGNSTVLALVLTAALNTQAWAQRAQEDALATADDAFGTTVGTETIGLYNPNSARGFSPIAAGNLRIEGLYFDSRAAGGRNVRLSGRVTDRSTVHVGLSAQSYPFPAPTGIADFSLRVPGDEFALSALVRAGVPEVELVEIDAQVPLPGNCSLGFGVSAEHGRAMDTAFNNHTLGGGVVGHCRFGAAEIIPFWSRIRIYDNQWGVSALAAGTDLPPKYDRGLPQSEDWSYLNSRDTYYGGVFRQALGHWRLNMGLFRSISTNVGPTKQIFLRNIQPNGDAELWYSVNDEMVRPHHSTSGEIRLSRAFTEGDRRHTLHINTRGRSSGTGSGGSVVRYVGQTRFGEDLDLPPPTFSGVPRGQENVRQIAGGLSYQLVWRGLGEFSAGVQKVKYERYTTFVNPSRVPTTKPWLYNSTLAVYLSDKLALYGSYTKGLEDAPRAPNFATNGGTSSAATLTQQLDGGVRYTLRPGLTFVAGVFEVEKPFFEVDQTNFFRVLGDVRNRGVEVSLSGSLAPGLTVVAGLVALEAQLSGPLVESGAMGKVPPGTVPLNATFNVQYGPRSWNGLSVDMRVSHSSAYYANVENTFKSPSETLVDAGARYRFDIDDHPAAVRFQVTNLLNTWEWQILGTQRQLMATPRRTVSLQLTVDY